jgi:hypothetical protein
MDFVGEIVEHEVAPPSEPSIIGTGGFPSVKHFSHKKRLRWRLAVESNKQNVPPVAQEMSEADKIHQENIEKISQMTNEEVSREREDLLRELDPKLIQSLLKRTQKRTSSTTTSESTKDPELKHSEAYEGWIGSMKTSSGLADLSQLDKDDVDKALGINNANLQDDLQGDRREDPQPASSSLDKTKKKVTFDNVASVKYEDLPDDVELDPNGWEDVEDLHEMIPNMPSEEIAHKDYQLVDDDDDDDDTPKLGVHFTKPKSVSQDDLDINDPEFYDKLHEKYYPDLPKETEKLNWMTEPMPSKIATTYESISDMRFDFKGNLIEIDDKSKDIPTYHGLHHHAEDPQMAGYTLTELARLSRSVVPGQRSVAIQTLGRILHKLGKHNYNILPVSEESTEESAAFDENIRDLVSNFENMMWDLIDELRVVDSISEAADEKKTRNLSVNNYAVEALWLWKQGGGRPKVKTEEEKILSSGIN